MLAASLGVAGFGALASLAAYRRIFIALALLALGYSLYLTLRKKEREGTLSLEGYRFGREDALFLGTALLVALAIAFPYLRAAALARSEARYEARGVVVSVDPGREKILLAHEEIRGLMPAMTMEFPVRSAELLDGLRAGDGVRFTLKPEGADFVIETIAREKPLGERRSP